MAYGNARRRREREPDIRDVVEDAARDAGLSVSEFIEAAVAEHDDDRRSRVPQRAIRLVSDQGRPLEALERRISGRAQDEMTEDRIASILGRAFEEIKASEQRTAKLIESIAGLSPAANTDRQPPRAVQDILASAERRVGPAKTDGAAELERIAARIANVNSRQEVQAALSLLERKLALAAPHSTAERLVLDGMAAEIAAIRSVVMAEGADVPIAAIERPLASLTQRLTAMMSAPRGPQPTPGTVAALEGRLDDVTRATASMVVGIQDELVRLGRNGLRRDDAAVDASFSRLENRIHQLEAASDQPLDSIRNDLRALQSGISQGFTDPALRSGLSNLEDKLDRIAGRISEPLRMVHNAVTQLNRQKQQPGPDAARLDEIFAELAALKKGLSEQGAASGLKGMAQAIVSISDRIDGIAHRMQQESQPDGQRDLRRKSVEDEIEEIKELLREVKSPCDDSRVLDAIGQLERKIAALEGHPSALMERLDRLQARLDQAPAAPGGGQAGSGSSDILLRNLAARLETMQMASGPDEAVIAGLQQEIRKLSGKIDSMPAQVAAAPAAAGAGSDQVVADILRQLDGIKADVGDRAARAAVEALRQMSSGTPAPTVAQPGLDEAKLEAIFGQLRKSQVESETRTNRTLEALHDTLHGVIDRLGQLSAQQAKAEPPRMPAPLPVAAPVPPAFGMPMPPQQAAMAAMPTPQMPTPHQMPMTAPVAAAVQPVQRNDDGLLPSDILEPRPAPQAALAVSQTPQRKVDGFAETLASMRSGSPAAVREEPKPASPIASAFAAAKDAMANLRAGRPAPEEVPAASHPQPAPQQAQPRPAAAAPDIDLPLEPGSGRPRPGAPRAATPSAQMSAPSAPSDAKSDFLAAARRAAQAAAQQTAAAQAETSERRGLRGLLGGGSKPAATASAPVPAPQAVEAAGGSGFRAKHAALLGTAAIIVAAGVSYTMLSGGQRAEAPPASPPPRTSSITPPASATPPQQVAAAPQRQQPAEAPRQILPPAIGIEASRVSATPPERPTTPPVAAAQPPRDEQITVGSLPAPERVPNANITPVDRNDPLFRFEGLRDGQRLREAALQGDPNAFFELGQRYADGRGAPRDPKTAAIWLERAAEHGHAPAQYRLGAMFREGRGVERNAKTALRHFQAAADAGNARGMHNTAVLLAEGVNGAPDYAQAGEWFRKAAEFGIRDSQYNLAILHARGLGVAQDLMASYAWFSAAATQGDEDALKKRDEVGSRLTPERLQQARAAAQLWKAKTPSAAANESVAPPGGWDTEAKQVPAGVNAPKSQPKRI